MIDPFKNVLLEDAAGSLLPDALCAVLRCAVCPCGRSVRKSSPYRRPNAACGWTGICLVCRKDSPRAVRARHRWVITPCLGNASDSVLLGPFVVTGRIMAREENQRRLLAGLPTVTSIIGGPPAMETPSCIPIRCAMRRGWRMA